MIRSSSGNSHLSSIWEKQNRKQAAGWGVGSGEATFEWESAERVARLCGLTGTGWMVYGGWAGIWWEGTRRTRSCRSRIPGF